MLEQDKAEREQKQQAFAVALEAMKEQEEHFGEVIKARELSTLEVCWFFHSLNLDDYVASIRAQNINGEMLMEDANPQMLSQDLGVKRIHINQVMRQVQMLRHVAFGYTLVEDVIDEACVPEVYATELHAQYDSRVAELEGEVQAKEAQFVELTSQFETRTQEKEQLVADKEQLLASIDALNVRIEELQAAQEEALANAQAQMQAKQEEMEAQQQAHAEERQQVEGAHSAVLEEKRVELEGMQELQGQVTQPGGLAGRGDEPAGAVCVGGAGAGRGGEGKGQLVRGGAAAHGHLQGQGVGRTDPAQRPVSRTAQVGPGHQKLPPVQGGTRDQQAERAGHAAARRGVRGGGRGIRPPDAGVQEQHSRDGGGEESINVHRFVMWTHLSFAAPCLCVCCLFDISRNFLRHHRAQFKRQRSCCGNLRGNHMDQSSLEASQDPRPEPGEK